MSNLGLIIFITIVRSGVFFYSIQTGFTILYDIIIK